MKLRRKGAINIESPGRNIVDEGPREVRTCFAAPLHDEVYLRLQQEDVAYGRTELCLYQDSLWMPSANKEAWSKPLYVALPHVIALTCVHGPLPAATPKCKALSTDVTTRERQWQDEECGTYRYLGTGYQHTM